MVLKFRADTTVSTQVSRYIADEPAQRLILIGEGKVVDANREGPQALGIGSAEPSSRALEMFRIVAVAPE